MFKTCFDFDPSGYKTDYVLAKIQKKDCRSLSDLQPINILVNNLDKLMAFNQPIMVQRPSDLIKFTFQYALDNLLKTARSMQSELDYQLFPQPKVQENTLVVAQVSFVLNQLQQLLNY